MNTQLHETRSLGHSMVMAMTTMMLLHMMTMQLEMSSEQIERNASLRDG